MVGKLTTLNIHCSGLTDLWFITDSTAPMSPPSPKIQYLWSDLAWHNGTVGIASDYDKTEDWPGYWGTIDEALAVIKQYNKGH